MIIGNVQSNNLMLESTQLNTNPRYSTIFMKSFSKLFTIDQIVVNTLCFYEFSNLD